MKKIFTTLVFFACILGSQAQDGVTIGSAIKPLQGTILDIKEQTADATTNITATKGLMLPRVELTTLTALTDISDADTSKPTAYSGLIVYNASTGLSGSIPAGVYIWVEDKWVSLSSSNQN